MYQQNEGLLLSIDDSFPRNDLRIPLGTGRANPVLVETFTFVIYFQSPFPKENGANRSKVSLLFILVLYLILVVTKLKEDIVVHITLCYLVS